VLIAFLALRKAKVWEKRKIEPGVRVLINRLPETPAPTNRPSGETAR
jgi:hypothetical protein